MSNEERSTRKSDRGSFRLGRLFGIEIRADLSMFIIFAIVLVSLGAGTLAQWHPSWGAGLRWTVALAAAAAFFGSILIHELSHVAVARAQGLRVRSITLFLFGGLAQIEEEPKAPRGEFAMAIVGPLTSLAIGFVATALGTALARIDSETLTQNPVMTIEALGPLPTLLLWLGPLNIVLGIFNLVPGFPLDGGRVLRSAVWALTGNLVTATKWAAGAGRAFAWLLIGTGVFMAVGGRIPFFGGGAFQGLWFVLIGWVLAGGARESLEQVVTKDALGGVPVSALMMSRFDVIDPRFSVGDVMREYLLRSDQHCFPVVLDGAFQGIVCWADVRRIAREDWDGTAVEAIMTPAESVISVRPDDDAAVALERLSRHEVDQLAVTTPEGQLLGLLRRRDVVKWMALHRRSEGERADQAFAGHIPRHQT
jgi:Zn-dependent protease/CBS domain-containing protein